MKFKPHSYGKAKLSILSQFEKANGARFPSDYKTFLLANNGGKPGRKRVETVKNDIQWFFGFVDQPSWASFQYAIDTFAGRLPSWYVPIARMEGGDLLIISLYPKNHGVIANWDHEREAALSRKKAAGYFDNLTFVAKSFKDLIGQAQVNAPKGKADKRLFTALRAPFSAEGLLTDPMPMFRYVPDPGKSGLFITNQDTCSACHKARGSIASSHGFLSKPISRKKIRLCPWCIADGTARRKLGLCFTPRHLTLEADDRRKLTSKNPPPSKKAYEELMFRTPPYFSDGHSLWFWHCGDFMQIASIKESSVGQIIQFKCLKCKEAKSHFIAENEEDFDYSRAQKIFDAFNDKGHSEIPGVEPKDRTYAPLCFYENEHRIRLPLDYIRFLGKGPITGKSSVRTANTRLKHFFSASHDIKTSVYNVLRDQRNRIPKDCFPIAVDENNALFLIRVGSKCHGEVIFSKPPAKIKVIARSFTDFLKKLSVAK